MCHIVVLCAALLGFFLPRFLTASTWSASAENWWCKSTPNKSSILGIAPGTFHWVPNGTLGVGIGASCYCEGIIVGHEKLGCVSTTPPKECSLAEVLVW